MSKSQVAISLLIAIFIYITVGWYFSSVIVVHNFTPPSEETLDFWNADWDVPPPEEIVVTSRDLPIITDLYRQPDGADCAAITVAGLGGSREFAGAFGFIPWDLGCHVIAYDIPSIQDDSVPLTYGYYEKVDLSNLLDYYAEELNIPSEDFGLIGTSYGAATILQMLQLRDDIAWIVADSPYNTLDGILRYQAVAQFGDWINLIYPAALVLAEQRANFDDVEVAAVSDELSQTITPILLIHSEADAYVPPENSEDIFAAANPETTELYLLDWESIHSQNVIDRRDEYADMVYDFLDEYAPDYGNTAAARAVDYDE